MQSIIKSQDKLPEGFISGSIIDNTLHKRPSQASTKLTLFLELKIINADFT